MSTQLPKTLRLANFGILLAIDEFIGLIPIPGLGLIWSTMSFGFMWVLCGKRYTGYSIILSLVLSGSKLIQASSVTASTTNILFLIPQPPHWLAELIVGIAAPILAIYLYFYFVGSIKLARKTLDQMGIRHE